jgi:hypothetical protein
MIYGYDTRTVNVYGLREMCEVSITAKPALLRSLAKFLEELRAKWRVAALRSSIRTGIDTYLMRSSASSATM